jgi:hypothetical protein
MASTEWVIKGSEFANCNCSYGCPCQFNALPTHGNCRGVFGIQIDEGHFAEVRLDGLRAVLLAATPGALHEGNGTMQLVIDERADARQRDALEKILSGRETEEMATIWWVLGAMCPTKLETLFKPITFDVDVEARRARLEIPGFLQMSGEPIRNPVTGAEHRVRIDLPDGFEYRIAEIGSGTTRCAGPIELDLKDSYGQFAHLHIGNRGVMG